MRWCDGCGGGGAVRRSVRDFVEKKVGLVTSRPFISFWGISQSQVEHVSVGSYRMLRWAGVCMHRRTAGVSSKSGYERAWVWRRLALSV